MTFAVMRDRREKIEGHFERSVKWLLSRAFTNANFFTISECAKYKPSESLDTWRQNSGQIPEVVEVYLRGEYICDLHSKMTRDQMINKVWKIMQLKAEAKKEVKKRAASNTASV